MSREARRRSQRRKRRTVAVWATTTVAALGIGYQMTSAGAQTTSAPKTPVAGGVLAQQRPLVDAATLVRTAADASGAEGLASIVLGDGAVQVHWKGGRSAVPQSVTDAIAAARKLAQVRVEDAKYDKSELLAASAKLEKKLTSNKRFGGISAEPDGSGLVVAFDPVRKSALKDGDGQTDVSAQALPDLPDVGVDVSPTIQEPFKHISKQSDQAPWSGGAYVSNPDQGTACTSGFGVNTPSGPAIIIAAHCGKTGQRHVVGGQLVGKVTGRDQNLDIALVPTSAVTNKVYTGNISSSTQKTVTGGGAPFIGEMLCQAGATSAREVGGPVCNLKVRAEGTDSQKLWQAVKQDYGEPARPGDSGGPVYDDRGDGTVLARGTNTYVGGNTLGFGGFDKYQQLWKVSIPGGSTPNPAPPTPTPTPKPTIPPPGGAGALVALAGKCADVRWGSDADGTPVQTWDCNGSPAQKWTATGGTLSALGKCLDAAGAKYLGGTQVQLRGCTNAAGQKWQVRADGSVYNQSLNQCLDVPNYRRSNGTQLIAYRCTDGANQRWTLK